MSEDKHTTGTYKIVNRDTEYLQSLLDKEPRATDLIEYNNMLWYTEGTTAWRYEGDGVAIFSLEGMKAARDPE